MPTNYVDKKATLSRYIERGAVGREILEEVLSDDGFVAIEGDLLDYKEGVGEVAKVVLQVVSFHNTYGGYLLFGIKEESELTRIPKGIEPGALDPKTLRDNIRAYTGESIAIEFAEIPVRVKGDDFLFGVLWVPKRSSNSTPIAFGKNGPQLERGRLLFVQGQIYYREQDNCQAALTSKQLSFLLGPRDNPYMSGEQAVATLARRGSRVMHNLPDRNFICPEFVGREPILGELWKWFADEFSTTRVLAGDGGKGKTSIAYYFAQSICLDPPIALERVIWLTAKKNQFNALHNQWVPVPETNFGDFGSLLKAIASELALLDEEIDGASEHLLKRQIRDALRVLPAMVIIDDVDSLDIEGQRMVLELAMQLASSKSKFLLTTRMNMTFSAESCIPIPGLPEDEFKELISSLVTRMQLTDIRSSSVSTMWQATGGSPLFAESVLRLVKLTGVKVESAISQWKGLSGDDVRRAALLREVERLTPEARRILLAASYMQDCSFTELVQATGYTPERAMACLTELHALFLISAPQLTQEARYQVASNTAKLVLDTKGSIVNDFNAIEARITRMRSGIGAAGKRDRLVGIAITESNAFKRAKRWAEALGTIEAALQKVDGNADLLLAKARCLFEGFPQRLDESRSLFRQAHAKGQRDAFLFDYWFRAETRAKSGAGMIDVATYALNQRMEKISDWHTKRALGHFREAAECERAGHEEAAIVELGNCARDLEEALGYETSVNDQRILERALVQTKEEQLRIQLKSAVEIEDIRQIWSATRLADTFASHKRYLLSSRIGCLMWLLEYGRGRGKERSLVKNEVIKLGGELQRDLEVFRKSGGDIAFVRETRAMLADIVGRAEGLEQVSTQVRGKGAT